MMGESHLFGVYLNAELVTSLLALVVTYGLHKILSRFGLLRQVWHRPLFETALFIIIWAVVLNFFTPAIS